MKIYFATDSDATAPPMQLTESANLPADKLVGAHEEKKRNGSCHGYSPQLQAFSYALRDLKTMASSSPNPPLHSLLHTQTGTLCHILPLGKKEEAALPEQPRGITRAKSARSSSYRGKPPPIPPSNDFTNPKISASS